jgi:hypothetical protein
MHNIVLNVKFTALNFRQKVKPFQKEGELFQATLLGGVDDLYMEGESKGCYPTYQRNRQIYRGLIRADWE